MRGAGGGGRLDESDEISVPSLSRLHEHTHTHTHCLYVSIQKGWMNGIGVEFLRSFWDKKKTPGKRYIKLKLCFMYFQGFDLLCVSVTQHQFEPSPLLDEKGVLTPEIAEGFKLFRSFLVSYQNFPHGKNPCKFKLSSSINSFNSPCVLHLPYVSSVSIYFKWS